MPVSVNAQIGREHYTVSINAGTNTLLADEPFDKGGQNKGFSPTELLLASLGACTSATLRMYADRKEMKLEEVKVHLEVERNEEENSTLITRDIELKGTLTGDEKQRLLSIANKCPIHKLLSSQIHINSKLV
jgi:putative redox protein